MALTSGIIAKLPLHRRPLAQQGMQKAVGRWRQTASYCTKISKDHFIVIAG